MKKTLATIVLSMLFGGLGAAIWLYWEAPSTEEPETIETKTEFPRQAVSVHSPSKDAAAPSFMEASERSTSSVVFIKTTSQYQRRTVFFDFFEFDPFGSIGKVSSSGSGVILSKDGYIVTNYHVVKNADLIEVVLNKKKRSYQAELIGTDPSSDLALLKIEGNNFQPITVGNSDDVRIGQWVLAVGNPFNLTSTVTAGIVSAKGRNINVVNNQFPIESFIQTDAAINPGNSGGALVNTDGELVGVNTAIASKTGSYVGYGFAIPSNLVSKIVQDLKEYGQVQRGFTGIEVADIDNDLYEKLKIDQGVYVTRVNEDVKVLSGSVKAGDVIVKVNEVLVEGKPLYDEQIAYKRPGDVVKLEISRNGSKKTAEIKLVNKEGTSELIKRESVSSDVLGADFEFISKLEKDLYNISYGVKTLNVRNGKIRKMNIQEGFIFTKINGKQYDSLESFVEALETLKGQVRIEGINPSGGKQFMSFYLY
jgi:Do/DeqQ family serine protease